MSGSFAVRSERSGRVHRATLTGELDIATAPTLQEELDSIADLAPETVLVVDLTELTFMDSTGLYVLLRLSERFPQRLRVVNGSSSVERLLDVSGVRDRLPIISRDTDPLRALP